MLKTDVYCKASLITAAAEAASGRLERDAGAERPGCQKISKIFDRAEKSGVYCEAPLIEAGSKTEAQLLWFIKNIQPISVGV